jgi:hypothetical protein
MKMTLHLRNLVLLAIFTIALSFTSIGQITLTSPLGGESWLGGTDQNIAWTTIKADPVLIELWDGSSYSTITTTVDGTSPYLWSISNSLLVGSSYKIKLTQDGDVSESATFTITPQSINVTTPNTALIWNRGTLHTIDWTDNVPGNVDIDLFDGTLYTMIASNVAGNSYAWPIPVLQTLGNTYKVRVSSVADAGINDESDVDFEITQAVALTSPNGTEIWYTGSTHNITWTDGSGTVTIELWDSNTSTKITDITTGATGNTYAWTIGATPNGSDYIIKVIDEGDASTDVSNADFRITQPVTITSPNGGEIWATTTTHNITWTEGTGTSTIDLYKGGAFVSTLASGQTSPYSWTIGALTLGSDYKIRITDEGDGSIDESNSNFRITDPIVLTQPDIAGIIWATTTIHNITWTDGSGTATIELYKGGIFNSTIASGVTSPYSWTIGALTSGSDYTVKITDNGDATTDISSNNFRITQPVVVTSPNGGQAWANLSTHNITWTGGTGNATIKLFKAGLELATLASGQTSPYSWAINVVDADTDYKIEVTDAGDLTTDQSNANFEITQYVHVTYPTVPGISWNLGSTNVITWTDNVPGPVTVELFYNGTFHETLAASVADGTTSYSWTIPNNHPMGNLWKIKIYSIADPTIVDYSDHYFRIDAATNTYDITVLQPSDAGLQYTIGETYLVSWTDNLNSPVKVELVNFGVTPATIATINASVVGSTCDWTVDGATAEGSMYKVMITSTTDNAVIDLSDNYFEISLAPAQTNIVIEQPTLAGITWVRGSTYLISWTDNVPNNEVTIKLLNGGTNATVATIATGVSGSTYYWYIDPLLYANGSYKIQVEFGGEYGRSLNNFTLADSPAGSSIDILQPDVSGITWVRGSSYLVSWIDDVPGPVDIYYYRNIAPFTETLIASSVVGTTYVWEVPVGITEANDYIIKVYYHADPSVFGVSANVFSIFDYLPGGTISVLQPNGGETWVKGSSYYISWDNNFDENVKIELVNDATSTTTLIENNVPGSTTVWTIPNTGSYPAGILYKVKITSVENSLVTDLSDNYFTIVDPAVSGVFPNPANQSVTIILDQEASNDYNLIITDRFNLQVVNRIINTTGLKEFNISTAELSNGVYFLTLTSDNSVITHKVIVQH